MMAEYLQLRAVARPCTAALDRNFWIIEYEERESLTHIDGYMIVYSQQCKITVRTSLPISQKHQAVNDLLHYLPQMVQPARHIFLWSVNDAGSMAHDV